ncbi:LamG-like jellyroll fold domain-containing protein [Roseimaritima ulvae]|uniref:PQQ enzyme repeat protein n=2 Tax=Roseimaritima ulvae TaxID=980254 RepID=A0A5B9QMZ2_9BACT|nr:LamG-like jellyroll fold domain-containing protein [Roseimaritima ulvae]QEG39242.1 PQQ enzyme repeat protein [Roseimaritima ulvae]
MLCVAFANAQQPQRVQQWRFEQTNFSGSVLRGLGSAKATTVKPPEFDDEGLLIFSGEQHLLVDQSSVPDLPRGSFTVEAWVRLEQTDRWGGMFGCLQKVDASGGALNGWKGWSLGTNAERFEMRCSDGDKLIAATATDPIAFGEWQHVVGVCDTTKSELRLYIDGKLSAEMGFVADSISYPDASFNTPLAIGWCEAEGKAYSIMGHVRELRLYEGVADESLIAAHVEWSQELPDRALEFSVRPGVRFLTPTSAEIRWDTTVAGEAGVAYGPTKKLGKIAFSSSTGRSHRVTLTDLIPGKNYWYRFGLVEDGKRTFSPLYQFDGTMNYSPPVTDVAADQELVDRIRSSLDQLGGFAVVEQGIDPAWAEAVADATSMTVVVCADEQQQMDQLRRRWYEQDAYGIRLSVQDPSSVPAAFSNLVVVDGAGALDGLRWRSATGCVIALHQRPEAAELQWQKFGSDAWFGRPANTSEKVAEWGHQYGSAGNAVYSGERLDEIDKTEDLEMRWIGRPGADFGTDRQPRMPAPLAIGGRLFHQGMNRMIALDAFNGAVLWSLEIPDLRRVNLPRDSSNWCADANQLYVAVKDRLWVIDAASGTMKDALVLPEPFAEAHEWGYLANTDDLIIGSATKAGSAYTSFFGRYNWFEASDAASTAKVSGDALVAYEKTAGSVRWTYPADGIVHSTIAIEGSHIYFVEVDDPSLKDAKTGKLLDSQIWPSASIVCLDSRTGEKLWQSASPVSQDQVLISFGISDDSQYILQTSAGGYYQLAAFDAETGKPTWSRDVKWSADDHSAHFQHAIAMNDRLYVHPEILDASDGSVIQTGTLGTRRGCATPVGLGNAVLFRGGSGPISFWSLKSDTRTEITRMRPSCWLSTIAAQGMLFSPEGGGGCSCGGWMETSIGFAPKSSKVKK